MAFNIKEVLQWGAGSGICANSDVVLKGTKADDTETSFHKATSCFKDDGGVCAYSKLFLQSFAIFQLLGNVSWRKGNSPGLEGQFLTRQEL